MSIRDQIRDGLRRRIESGELQPNSAIPSEREMALALGVSRMTVRAALDELAADGLLLRRQGRKSIIAAPKISHSAAFMSFSEEMRVRGWKPHSEVRQFTATVADVATAAQLNLAAGAKVIYLERLRFADDEPLAFERVYLPFDRFQRVLEMDLVQDSLYSLLEREFGTRPIYAAESVESVLLSDFEAGLFCLQMGMPALLTRRVTYDDDAVPIEAATILYRGDRYRMVLARQR